MSIQTMFRKKAIALLHQALAEYAERDGVSLNQYVVMLLARGEAEDRVTRRNDVYNLTAAQANRLLNARTVMARRITRFPRPGSKYPQSETIPSPYDPDYMLELEGELQKERAARQTAEAEFRRLREQLRQSE